MSAGIPGAQIGGATAAYPCRSTRILRFSLLTERKRHCPGQAFKLFSVTIICKVPTAHRPTNPPKREGPNRCAPTGCGVSYISAAITAAKPAFSSKTVRSPAAWRRWMWGSKPRTKLFAGSAANGVGHLARPRSSATFTATATCSPMMETSRRDHEFRRIGHVASRHAFHGECNTLAATDAERDDRPLHGVTLHRMKETSREDGSRRTDWMSMCNCTAFDIDNVLR